MILQQAPGIEFAGASDVGSVREENQDSIRLPEAGLPLERGLLYALADGMGGLAHGKLASAMAVDAAFEALYASRSPISKSLGRGVELANSKVFGKAQALGPARMGTTLTLVDILGEELWLAHVGDSRAYLVREGSATLLTNDHTSVGELVRMKLLSPDKVRTHAQRSTLSRAVGIGLFVRPDLAKVRLRDEDRVLICSDGLWSVIEDEELGARVGGCGDLDEACDRLVKEAIERGSDDNVSAIAIRVREARKIGGAAGEADRSRGRFYSGLAKSVSALLKPSSADN
jgi:protein phosphatase